jgi:MYXO-CTERM domain-containing protein
MKAQRITMAAIGLAALASAPALGGYSVVQGPTGPTYAGQQLNFDEPGGPTGLVSPDAWLATHGITIQAGDGAPQVDDWATITGQPWLGENNSFYGNFGVFITFTSDVTEFAVEIWDPSGPPSPFGGGLAIYLFNDGNQVFADAYTPAWGGVGDPSFDITTDGGSVFDEVRILGNGFTPTTYADNLSWNPVPTPGALALLGLAGILGRRRRRA